MSEEKLAQPDDVMFERNIAHIAKGGREVEIWIEGLREPKRGFIAGLDEEYIQLCMTQTATLSSMRRDLIISMDETGDTIESGFRLSHPIEEDHWRMIQKKVDSFQKKAIHLISGGSL